MLLSVWLHNWLTVWCADKRPSTVSGYESTIRNHIAPALGHLALDAFTPEHVQLLINAIRAKGYTRTAQIAFDVLHAACGRAVRSGHLAANPLDRVDRPDHVPQRGYAFTVSEEAAYIAVAIRAPLWPAFALMLRAGLRRGEVIALSWQDVDLPGRWLHIRRTATPIKGQLVLGPPKSRASLRSIPICDSLHDALAASRLSALAAGLAGRDQPVVAAEGGGLICPDDLRDANRTACTAARVPAVRLHDLRHPYVKHRQIKISNIFAYSHVGNTVPVPAHAAV